MKARNLLFALIILLLGAAGAAFIVKDGKSSASDSEARDPEIERNSQAAEESDTAPIRGEHGGRLFPAGDFTLEATVFESGIPPEFRFYLTWAGKPVAPSEAQVNVRLARLGQPSQEISFVPEGDYLRGEAEIVEPHSFEVEIHAAYRGKSYTFRYAQEEARVRMTDVESERAGIEVLAAGPRRIADTLHLPGEIHLNRDHLVHVVSPLAGIAVNVKANAGDQVKRGQVLAVVSSQSLAQLRNSLAAAEARVALARQSARREKKLWQEGIAPEQDYLTADNEERVAEIDANSARQQLAALGLPGNGGNPAQFELRALADGTVLDKHLAVGESVRPETPLFTLADLSTVWAEAKVGARDVGKVAPGQVTRVLAAGQGLEATGTLSYVSALLGEED